MKYKIERVRSKILVVILFAMFFAFSSLLVACTDPYKNMKLTVDKSNVTIYLGVTQDDTVSVIATVSGSKKVLSSVFFSPDSNKVSIVETNYLGEGKTEVKIKGLVPCSLDVKVQTLENNVSTKIHVDVVQPITSLTQKLSIQPYVLRGENNLIDVSKYVNFNPSNTLQKDVELALLNNYEGISLSFVDGNYYLNVDDESANSLKTITISVSSTNRNIAPLNLDFDILSPFDFESDNFKLTYEQTQGEINLKPTQGETPSIYLAHNDEDFAQAIVSLEVPYTDKEIIIEPKITNDTLATIVKKTYTKTNNSLRLDVLIASGNRVGDDCYLYFDLKYDGYNYLYSTQEFKTKLFSYDIVKSIVVDGTSVTNNQSIEMDIYSSYANSYGRFIEVQTFPTTVLEKYKTLYLSSQDLDKIEILNEEGKPFNKNENGHYEIKDGQGFYVRAKQSSTEQAEILITSSFSADFYSGTERVIECSILLNLYEGANELKFYAGENNEIIEPKFYIDNSKQSTETIYFYVAPANVKLENFTVESEGDFTTSDIFSVSEVLDSENVIIGKIFAVNLTSKATKQNQVGFIEISCGNGRRIYAPVNLIVPITDNARITTQSPQNNDNIGYLKYDNVAGSDFAVAITNGNSSEIAFDTQNATFEVFYRFLESEKDDANYSTFGDEIALGNYSENCSFLNLTNLQIFSQLSALHEGKIWVEVNLKGKELVKQDGLYQYTSLQDKVVKKYFFVEIYNPVISFTSSVSSIDLFALDSVGYYNQNLAKASVKISVNENKLPATYNTIECKDGDLGDNGDYFSWNFDQNSGILSVVANSMISKKDETRTYGNDGHFTFIVDEFGVKKYVTVRVFLKSAERVNGINLNNVNEEEGIYLELTQNSTFKIDASIENLSAFNKNLMFGFVSDLSTSSDFITIDSFTGLIKANHGGAGYIIVAPQDAYVSDEKGQPVLEDKLGVSKKIRIVVADGKSRTTSIRINDLNEIKDTTLHYTLMQDVEIPATWQTRAFSGGLYGCLEGQSPKTITTTKTIFDILAYNAIIQDLIVMGQISGQAFVANSNYGEINNVIVDTFLKNNEFEPSKISNNVDVLVGGLVAKNNGTIVQSCFFGQIDSSGIVGGIAGENNGVINLCQVEFYKFNDTLASSIKGEIVGGLVGINGEKATLSNSYCYNYHDQDCLVGTEVGALTGENKGKIFNCFAKTNVGNLTDEPWGNDGSVSAQNIQNCYIFEVKIDTQNYKFINNEKKYYSEGRNIFQSDFASFYNGKINIGSNSIWKVSANKNDGYPYLSTISQNDANELVSLKLSKSEQVLVDENNKLAIFMFFEKEDNITTTASEDAVIRSWNTIPFTKLFGVENANGIRVSVTSGDANVLTITNNSLILEKVGKVKISVFSKYDFSLKTEYEIEVIYNISNFEIIYNGEKLNDNSTLRIKKNSTDYILTSLDDQKIALGKVIKLKQNKSLQIKFDDNVKKYVISNANQHVIDTTSFEKSSIRFDVNILCEDKEDSVNDLLTQNFSHYFTVSTFKGADSIDINYSDFSHFTPKDEIIFESVLYTDDKDDFLNILITDKYNSSMLNYDTSYNAMFEGQNGEISSVVKKYEVLENGIWVVKNYNELDNYQYYKITLQTRLKMLQEFWSLDFGSLELNINVSASSVKEVCDDVKLILDSLFVEKISFSSHTYKNWEKESGYIFNQEPNNVVSPGQSNLLKINIYPHQANFEYIEITSNSVDSNNIYLQLLKANNEGYLRDTIGFVRIDNGIRILKQNFGYSSIGEYFVLMTIPSMINIDTIFTITAKVVKSSGDIVKESTFNVVCRPIIEAKLTINDEEQIVMAKGTSATLQAIVQKDQEISSLTTFVEGEGELYGISLGEMTSIIDDSRNVKVYTCKLFVSEDVRFINMQEPIFYVKAVASKVVDGTLVEVSTSVKIVVVDFLIENITLDNNSDVLSAYVGIEKGLDFNFETTMWNGQNIVDDNILESIDSLNRLVATFKEHNYLLREEIPYSNKYYILNYHEDDANINYKNFLNNLYYVNADGSSTKVLSSDGSIIANPYFNFIFSGNGVSSDTIFGTNLKIKAFSTGEQNMKFVFAYLTPDGNKHEITYNFTISITTYTDEDKPVQISTAEDFYAIANEAQAQDYILMNDLELTLHTPFDTSKINSFDGNNRVITIRSFDLTQRQGSSIQLALFSSVTSNSILKNITVNYYHLNNLVVDTSVFKTVELAGFAISNAGIITNCHVLAIETNSNLPSPIGAVGLSLAYNIGQIGGEVSSTLAGFVINNNGVITNSRVGGEEFEVARATSVSSLSQGMHELNNFTLSAQGNIVGFVYSNNGKISSSFTNKIDIKNDSAAGLNTISAGFVGFNTSGEISLSYSKGAYADYQELKTTGTAISTNSIGAGFVYNNNSKISNCYSNIMLKDVSNTSGRNSAGFVYVNSGNIEQCYSSSLIENSKTTQMDFNGVDDYGNLLNTGTITNSYYYNPKSSDSITSDMEETYSSGVLRVDTLVSSDIFYGFSFASVNSQDGVWTMTSSRGPELISANEIAVSSRYILTADDGNDFMFVYEEGYEYGSSKNPILIRNASEFNEVFGKSNSSAIKEYYNLSNNTVFGNYRMINDIDLSELVEEQEEYKLSSSNMSLYGGVFEGNNMTIDNLELAAPANLQQQSFGLFSKIENNAIFKNTNITLIGINAGNIQNVGAVAGILSDSKIVNIKLSAVYGTTGNVLGQNVVGGIVGFVKGNSSLINLSVSDIVVTADFYNENIERQPYIRFAENSQIDNNALSYAGGIAGIVDIYTPDFFADIVYSADRIMSFSNLASLKTLGSFQVKGATAGGVLGYLGLNSACRDLSVEVSRTGNNFNQKITAYKFAAGGLIGENYGDVTQSKIEHSSEIQDLIENNVSAYYNKVSDNKGYMDLFSTSANENYSPIFVGGLIGQTFSGNISNSYSKINVYSNAAFVGGLIGGIGDYFYSTNSPKNLGRNYFDQVYAFGDVYSTKADGLVGGLFGFVEYIGESINEENSIATIIINGANAVNFFNREYEDNDFELNGNIYNLKNIYDFYASTFYNGTIVRADEYDKSVALMSLTEDNANESERNKILNYVISSFTVDQKTYEPKRSVYLKTNNNNIKTINSKLESFNSITNPSVDGNYIDVAFRNNNWDLEKWERKTNWLLPKIVFTVSSSVYYIRTSSDLYLMEKYPDKTFIIIGTGLSENGEKVYVDCSDIEQLDIKNFRGVLKGYMPDRSSTTYPQDGKPLFGLKNLNLSDALITNASNGAVFSDFILLDCHVNNYDDTTSTKASAILVNSAQGVVFRNLIIENCYINTINSNAALVAGDAENSLFDTIDINNFLGRDMVSQSSFKDSNVENLNSALVVAKVSGFRTTNIKNVIITNDFKNYGINVNPTNLQSNNTTVNSGLIVGCAEGGIVKFDYEIKDNEKDSNFIINGEVMIFVANNALNDKIEQNINIGSLAGIISATSFNINGFTDIGKCSLNVAGAFKNSNIGGIVGLAKNSFSIKNNNKNYNFNIYNNIIYSDTGTTGISNLGGIIASTEGSFTASNVQVSADNACQISSIKETNVGGVIGYARKNLNIDGVIISKNLKFEIKSTNLVGGNFGGFIGKFDYIEEQTSSRSKITKSYSYLNFDLTNFNGNVNFGGAIANVQSRKTDLNILEISESYFGNDLEFNTFKNMEYNLGGILGYCFGFIGESDTVSGKSISLNNNIAYGNIIQKVNSLENVEVYAGGLVGQGTANTNLQNNIVLTTIEQLQLPTTTKNHVKALVANGAYGINSFENFYCSQITLCTDSYLNEHFENGNTKLSTNLSYSSILERILNAEELINVEINNGSDKFGHKLKPFELTNFIDLTDIKDESNSLASGKKIYYRLVEDINYVDNSLNINNKNFALIGDGKTIAISNKEGRIFDEIPQNSFVSGISILVPSQIYMPDSYEKFQVRDEKEVLIAEYKNIYAPLSAVNNGIVFACAIKGQPNEFSESIDAKLDSRAKIFANSQYFGGLVGINTGLISDCLTEIEIVNIAKTTKVEENGKLEINESITSGFVAVNYGFIANSYSSGTINAPNGTIYAFNYDAIKLDGENEKVFGDVRSCFSIAQACNSSSEKLESSTIKYNSFVFGAGADKTCFYDVYATGVSDESQAIKLITSQMNNGFEINENGLVKNDLQNLNSFKNELSKINFASYITDNFVFEGLNNYGYPSFGNSYISEEYNYLKIEGINANQQILVGNIGVLRLAATSALNNLNNPSNNRKNIVLINNIKVTSDMGCVNDIEFKPTDVYNFDVIEEITNVNIDGNNQSISGIKIGSNSIPFEIDKQYFGIFTTIRNCDIANLILSEGNVIVNTEEANNYYVGTLAGRLDGVVLNNVKNLGMNVKAQSSRTIYVGGISGYVSSSTIQDVTNSASVVSTTLEKSENICYAGGLFGLQEDTFVTKCDNQGAIIAGSNSATNAFSAGITADVKDNRRTSNIENCINFGLVTSLVQDFEAITNEYTDLDLNGGIIEFSKNIEIYVQDEYALYYTGLDISAGSDKGFTSLKNIGSAYENATEPLQTLEQMQRKVAITFAKTDNYGISNAISNNYNANNCFNNGKVESTEGQKIVKFEVYNQQIIPDQTGFIYLQIQPYKQWSIMDATAMNSYLSEDYENRTQVHALSQNFRYTMDKTERTPLKGIASNQVDIYGYEPREDFVLSYKKAFNNGMPIFEDSANFSLGDGNTGIDLERLKEFLTDDAISYLQKEHNLNSNTISFDYKEFESIEIEDENPSNIGDGSKENPFLVQNEKQFLYALKYANSMILDKNYLSLGTAVKVNEKFAGLLFGNDSLVSFETQGQVSLFNNIDKTGEIENLKILYLNYGASDASPLSNFNYGSIKDVTTFGTIGYKKTISNGKVVEEKLSDENQHFVSGLVQTNNGVINSSNNYMLLFGTSGKNGNNLGENGISANFLAGIAGETTGNILNCYSFGSFVGGNGGNGRYGKDGESGKYANIENNRSAGNGTNGGNGGHGGNASVIGGVVGLINVEEKNINVSGDNFGIVISGQGGAGGNGGNGGAGGDADFLMHAFNYEILPAGAGGAGGAGGNGGSVIVGRVAGVSNINIPYNDGNYLFESYQLPGLAGQGGAGGRGGNGIINLGTGASIAGKLYINSQLWGQFIGTCDVGYAGGGGGAGGNGYNGNTSQALAFSYLTSTNKENFVATSGEIGQSVNDRRMLDKDYNGQIWASAGKGGTGSSNGQNGQNSRNFKQNISWYIGDSIGQSLIDWIINCSFDFNFRQYESFGLAGEPSELNSLRLDINGSNMIGYSTSPLRIENKICKVESLSELSLALSLFEAYNANPDDIYQDFTTIQLQNDFGTTDDILTLKEAMEVPEGCTIDGNGKTIYYSGSGRNIFLFERVNGTVNNLKIYCEINNLEDKITQGSDLLTNDLGERGKINNCVLDNRSNIQSDFYKEFYMAKFKVKALSNNLINFKRQTPFEGAGTNNAPFEINRNNFDDFVSLVNECDESINFVFELTENVSIEKNENEFVINNFYGTLDGSKMGLDSSIKFAVSINDLGLQNAYYAFVKNNYGTLTDLKIDGTLTQTSFAQVNYGIIKNCVTKDTAIINNETGLAGGICLANRGEIINCTNQATITACADAGGICVYNFGDIKDDGNAKETYNRGKVSAGNGRDSYFVLEDNTLKLKEAYSAGKGGNAAGIAVYNAGSISNAINTGEIKAGNGGKGNIISGIIIDNSPNKTLVYNSQDGGEAAGICVYNSMVYDVDDNLNFIDVNIDSQAVLNGCQNTGKVIGGFGGDSDDDRIIVGNGGDASGIVCFNYMSGYIYENGQTNLSVLTNYGKVKTASNTGIIIAGNGGMDKNINAGGFGGNAGAISSNTLNNILYKENENIFTYNQGGQVNAGNGNIVGNIIIFKIPTDGENMIYINTIIIELGKSEYLVGEELMATVSFVDENGYATELNPVQYQIVQFSTASEGNYTAWVISEIDGKTYSQKFAYSVKTAILNGDYKKPYAIGDSLSTENMLLNFYDNKLKQVPVNQDMIISFDGSFSGVSLL